MPRFKILALTLVAAAISAAPLSAQPSTVVVAGHGIVAGGAVVTVGAFDVNGLVGGVLRVESAPGSFSSRGSRACGSSRAASWLAV